MKATKSVKANVCRMTNNFIKEGYSKSAAFVRAWIMVKLDN